MIFYIIAGILLLFIPWLLFAPVSIRFDSSENLYMFKFPGIIKGKFIPNLEKPEIKFYVFGIPIKIRRKKSVFTDMEKEPRPNKRKINGLKMVKVLPKLIKSFKIKRLFLNIDTGDFARNAQLIPVMQSIEGRHIHARINFMNEFELYGKITNNLFKILTIVIVQIFKNRNHGN